MKFYYSEGVENVAGRGFVYLVPIPLDERLPLVGETIILDYDVRKVAGVEIATRGNSRLELVGIVCKI